MPSLFAANVENISVFVCKNKTSAKTCAESVENYILFNSLGGGASKLHLLVVVLVEIETTGNHRKLYNYGFQTSSEDPFI